MRISDWSSDVFSSDLATEALNWALFCGAEIRPGGAAGLSIEHAASLQCLERLNANILPVDGKGLVFPPDDTLIPENGLVEAMLVHNEVGKVRPVADFAAAAPATTSLLLFHAVEGSGRSS